MLRIAQLEQIEQLLLKASALIEAQRADRAAYPDMAELWIRDVEIVLGNNRLSTSGQLAGFRGLLLSAGQGTNSIGITFSGKVTRRKVRRAVAADIINRVISVVEGTIHSDRARINEATAIALRLVSQANHEQLINSKTDDFEYSKYLYKTMSSRESMSEGISVLEGLVGKVDSIVSIDRALSYLGS